MAKGWKANKLESLVAKHNHDLSMPEHSGLQSFQLPSHFPKQAISNSTIQ